MWVNQLSLFLLFQFSGGYQGSEIATLILARGGSKGLYLKNLQTVGGVKLITRAIHTAKLAGLNQVTVSTDHPAIALEAIRGGATVFRRSRVSATDWAPSLWGASEFLASKPKATVLVLLQATSPFTRAIHLRLALDKLQNLAADCAFSATRSHKLRWTENRGRIKPLNFNATSRPRRQDWNGEILETGSFYISRRALIESGQFQNHNCTFVEVTPLESFEIDSYSDLKLANILLRANFV